MWRHKNEEDERRSGKTPKKEIDIPHFYDVTWMIVDTILTISYYYESHKS